MCHPAHVSAFVLAGSLIDAWSGWAAATKMGIMYRFGTIILMCMYYPTDTTLEMGPTCVVPGERGPHCDAVKSVKLTSRPPAAQR